MVERRKRKPRPSPVKEGQCVHFTGIFGPGWERHRECKAGVNYEKLVMHSGPPNFEMLRKLPCIAQSSSTICGKLQLPTREQMMEYRAWSETNLKDTMVALKLCLEDASGLRGVSGTVVCPTCQGTLHYSVAKVNGHLWGKCDTPGCLSWMQ